LSRFCYEQHNEKTNNNIFIYVLLRQIVESKRTLELKLGSNRKLYSARMSRNELWPLITVTTEHSEQCFTFYWSKDAALPGAFACTRTYICHACIQRDASPARRKVACADYRRFRGVHFANEGTERELSHRWQRHFLQLHLTIP